MTIGKNMKTILYILTKIQMKVSELIEKLKEIDWDAEIMLKVYEYNPDIDYWETMEYNKIIPSLELDKCVLDYYIEENGWVS